MIQHKLDLNLFILKCVLNTKRHFVYDLVV